MQFSDITGLDNIKSALLQSVRNNHVAHAQLFLGAEGSGALALALAYAQYVNCESPTGQDSCGVCASCRKYEKLIHPDLHCIFPTTTTKKISKSSQAVSSSFMAEWRSFITENHYPILPDWAAYIGAENKQCNISKEESRNIIRALSLKSFEAKYKVMLIWLPEWMHPFAANALLKILEEPPSNTLFLMVSYNADQLLTTITSRLQIIHIPLFSDKEVANYLQSEYDLSIEKSQQVAFLAEGNLNKGIKLQTGSDLAHIDFFKQWMRICFKADFTNMLQFSEQFFNLSKEDQKGLLHYGINILREAMLWKFNAQELIRLNEDEKSFIANFSEVFDYAQLEKIYQQFNNSFNWIERNSNPRILFTNLSIFIIKVFKVG